MREHLAPVRQLALGKETREGENGHPQALGTIEPRPVALEAE